MSKACLNIWHILPFLKTISDENRLKIICYLRDGEKPVCKIVEFTQLPQNLVSHHLKKLKEVWLVKSKKEWLKVRYSLNNEEVKKYLWEISELFNN